MHEEPFALNHLTQVAPMLTAKKVALSPHVSQCASHCQATHYVAGAYIERGIRANSNDILACIGPETHRASFPCSACQALNSHSARCQSSRVSISCTRWRGKNTGT